MKLKFSGFIKFVIPCLLLMAPPIFAQKTVGFSKGNNLNILNLSGRIRLASPCRYKSPTSYEIIKCSNNDLQEGNEDFFNGPVNNQASIVVLKAINSEGDVTIKKFQYNGLKGQTFNKVNLWYDTFFQTPLLKEGSNEIEFKLKNNVGDVLETGVFTVQVTKLSEKTCGESNVHALTSFECNMQKSVCRQYFKENNFCQ